MPHPDLKRSDTAEALLDAAEQLFSEKGYAAVGIREIVDRAGANVAAVSYHFGSKSELYLATVRRAMHRRQAAAVWDILDPVPASRREAAVALVRFIHRFLSRLLLPEDGGVASRLILREAVQPSEAIDSVVREYIQPNEAILVGVIEVLVPDARPRELSLLAESVLGQILHYRVFRPFLERTITGSLSGPRAVHRVADHIARFTLRGLGCSPRLVDQAIAQAKAVDHEGSTPRRAHCSVRSD